MDLHPGEQELFSGHPSWRSIIGFYIIGTIIGAVLLGIGIVADKTGIGAAAFGAVLVVTIIVGLLKRIGTTYTISSERLSIQRGILSRKRQETSLERVQNVVTNQSFLERILQVGTVDFDTAGTADSDFKFAGVADPEDIVRTINRVQREAKTGSGTGV